MSERAIGIAVEEIADGDGGNQTVVVAAPERRAEEEMAGLLEAGERTELGDAPADVG